MYFLAQLIPETIWNMIFLDIFKRRDYRILKYKQKTSPKLASYFFFQSFYYIID